MAVQDTSVMPARLAFGTTFGAAFSTVFGRFWSFIKAALLPLLVSIVFGMVGFAALSAAPMLVVPLQIISLLTIAIFGIACCRLALIGRQARAIPRPLFGRRTWATSAATCCSPCCCGCRCWSSVSLYSATRPRR